jgi:spermidine synthase
MIPWHLLHRSQVPGENRDLCLYQRGEEFSIRVDGFELMNNRAHGSEDAMAELACARIADLPSPKILIGGLGMGYTLAATLNRLGAESRVVVAELVPAVVAWNRGPLAAMAGRPLDDDRVTVREVDVAQILQAEHRAYDAILLDVDNGPRGLIRKSNDWLYTRTGLDAAFTALRPAGVFALWSASPNLVFTQLLRKVGFEVSEIRVRARGRHGGGYHTIWIAGRFRPNRNLSLGDGYQKRGKVND